MVVSHWSKDIVHRTWRPVGERICGVIHREVKGWITQQRDIRYFVGSQGDHRELALGILRVPVHSSLGYRLSAPATFNPSTLTLQVKQ